jgi:hypothetical protein
LVYLINRQKKEEMIEFLGSIDINILHLYHQHVH